MNDAYAMLEKTMLAGGDDALLVAYKGMMGNSTLLSLDEYVRAQAKRLTLQREWADFLHRYPLLLLPASWKVPFAVDLDQTDSAGMRDILDAQSPLLSTAILSLPGLAVPMQSVNGIPSGVQLVAGRFNENLCLDAADAIDAQRGEIQAINPVRAS